METQVRSLQDHLVLLYFAGKRKERFANEKDPGTYETIGEKGGKIKWRDAFAAIGAGK